MALTDAELDDIQQDAMSTARLVGAPGSPVRLRAEATVRLVAEVRRLRRVEEAARAYLGVMGGPERPLDSEIMDAEDALRAALGGDDADMWPRVRKALGANGDESTLDAAHRLAKQVEMLTRESVQRWRHALEIDRYREQALTLDVALAKAEAEAGRLRAVAEAAGEIVSWDWLHLLPSHVEAEPVHTAFRNLESALRDSGLPSRRGGGTT